MCCVSARVRSDVKISEYPEWKGLWRAFIWISWRDVCIFFILYPNKWPSHVYFRIFNDGKLTLAGGVKTLLDRFFWLLSVLFSTYKVKPRLKILVISQNWLILTHVLKICLKPNHWLSLHVKCLLLQKVFMLGHQKPSNILEGEWWIKLKKWFADLQICSYMINASISSLIGGTSGSNFSRERYWLNFGFLLVSKYCRITNISVLLMAQLIQKSVNSNLWIQLRNWWALSVSCARARHLRNGQVTAPALKRLSHELIGNIDT